MDDAELEQDVPVLNFVHSFKFSTSADFWGVKLPCPSLTVAFCSLELSELSLWLQ
jgi:hypothetical protein